MYPSGNEVNKKIIASASARDLKEGGACPGPDGEGRPMGGGRCVGDLVYPFAPFDNRLRKSGHPGHQLARPVIVGDLPGCRQLPMI